MLALTALISLSPFILSALGTPVLEARDTVDTSVYCGQWDSVAVGSYSLLLDLWDESGATSGSQCSHLTSLDGSTVSWTTNWTWVGGTGVKSFSNIQLNEGINTQVSAISSMPVSSISSIDEQRKC